MINSEHHPGEHQLLVPETLLLNVVLGIFRKEDNKANVEIIREQVSSRKFQAIRLSL